MRVVEFPQVVDSHVAADLRAIADRIDAGDVRSVAITVEYRDTAIKQTFASDRTMSLIGIVDILKRRIIEAWEDAR